MGLDRRRLLVAVMVAPLAGCGFELRKAPELHFQTIQLKGFRANSPLADELTRSINATPNTRVVEAATQAQVILTATLDARERSVVASTASGQVRELTLRARLVFNLRTSGGRELLGSTEIVQTRDLTYSETIALAKEEEEGVLFRSMQDDIVAQLMRRLAALRLPA
jgi:LPS-assembly lipoprotein